MTKLVLAVSIAVVVIVGAFSTSPTTDAYVLYGPKWQETCFTHADDPLLSEAIAFWGQWAPVIDCGVGPEVTLAFNATMGAAGYAIAYNNGKVITHCDIVIRVYTLEVMAHEMGHCLGIGHSLNPNALMYWRGPSGPNPYDPDDIQGVQALYGSKAPEVFRVTIPAVASDK